MNNLGLYVQYKGKPYIVVKVVGDEYHLNSPVTGTPRVKVKASSFVELCLPKAEVVELNGSNYIVTSRGNIFSCGTGKLMKWPANHGGRKALLATTKEQ